MTNSANITASIAGSAAFFGVTGFDQLQHYKDRGPTWIKLYNRMLDDYAFSLLPDAAKWHLIGIFLIASRHNNRIPADPVWLGRQIGAGGRIDLTQLERAGFITPIVDTDVGGAFDLFGNPASPEKRRAEEKREEKNPLSAGADPLLSEGIFPKKEKKKYPDDFENFWSSYPTDPLMSKIRAYDQWRRMQPADRVAAQGAVPAFRAFVAKQVNYRVVHAQRYLSERRYEGFAGKVAPDAATIAAAKDRADRLLKRGKYAEKYA